ARPTCPTLEADDPFDRSYMIEAPAAEIILEIDELLRQFVERPMLLRLCVDLPPGFPHIGVLLPGPGKVGTRLVAHVESVAGEQGNGLVINGLLRKDRSQALCNVRPVRVGPKHCKVTVAGKVFNGAVLP